MRTRWWIAVAMVAGAVRAAPAETYEPTGTLEVRCMQPHVTVLLDGRPWFTCPRSVSQHVRAGDHVVHGEAGDLVPATRQVTVPENGVAQLDIRLAARRRFPTWLPWTLTGGGIAVAVLGGLVYVAGSNGMNEYDQRVASECAVNGCTTEDLEAMGLTDLRDTSERRTTAGSIMLVGGVAMLATGFVLHVLNRPVLPAQNVAVIPTATGVTAQAAWSF